MPAGVNPADAIISSPLLGEFGGAYGGGMDMGGDSGAAGDAGGQFADYGGIDPSLDPELAMAIRASAEEARAYEAARVRSHVKFSIFPLLMLFFWPRLLLQHLMRQCMKPKHQKAR